MAREVEGGISQRPNATNHCNQFCNHNRLCAIQLTTLIGGRTRGKGPQTATCSTTTGKKLMDSLLSNMAGSISRDA